LYVDQLYDNKKYEAYVLAGGKHKKKLTDFDRFFSKTFDKLQRQIEVWCRRSGGSAVERSGALDLGLVRKFRYDAKSITKNVQMIEFKKHQENSECFTESHTISENLRYH
jgi:hypothetical protein